MSEFDEKQIEVLKGSFTSIGKLVGCTREYVAKVLRGEAGNKRDGEKAFAIKEKARELLAVLQPSE